MPSNGAARLPFQTTAGRLIASALTTVVAAASILGATAAPARAADAAYTIELVSVEETVYDKELAWELRVSVTSSNSDIASFQVSVQDSDGVQRKTASGGEFTFTGAVVPDAEAQLSVTIVARRAFGVFHSYITFGERVPLGWEDHPHSVNLTLDDWFTDDAGVWWSGTATTDSLQGGPGQVCDFGASACRLWVYGVTDSGARYALLSSKTIFERRGVNDIAVGNIGGTAATARDYDYVYAEVVGQDFYGHTVRIQSPPVEPGTVGPDFVYVALGDSYQSGEGAGNSIADTWSFMNLAYENGSNYPDQVGPEENTYRNGNRCHRALANYAKLNRDRLAPGANVILVDETCSGAKIEPGGKPPIVGTVGGGVAANSQISDALTRLEGAGLTADDVDLVTVGMGGNDARFSDIVAGCVAPSLVREILNAYPDRPGELQFLADHVFTCDNIDTFGVKTDEAIDALQAKEEWAQAHILAAFPNARILQVNYPDILPDQDVAPAWCGGISKGDIATAKDKIAKIDAAIAASIEATGDPRLEAVDIHGAFGANALCPGAGGVPLANGFDQANVQAEVDRLLNTNGDGDVLARALVDSLVVEYKQYKDCIRNKTNPFDGDCDLTEEWNDVTAAAEDLGTYLEAVNQDEIVQNLIEPPGPYAEPDEVRLNRASGLFHPNGAGYEVMACNVEAAFLFGSPNACVTSLGVVVDKVNGEDADDNPLQSFIDDLIEILFGGFAPFSPVTMTFNSDPVDLGTVYADSNGQVDVTIQVPDAGPGVHRVRLEGTGLGGVQVVKEFKVELPGDPVPGQDYGVYLTGFQPSVAGDGVTEYVDVRFMGATFTTTPDSAGGVFIEIPLPEDSADINIEAVSSLTGHRVAEVVTVVNPDAILPAQWSGAYTSAPDWNVTKDGRAVPLRFRLADASGAPLTDPSAIDLRVYPVDCVTGLDMGSFVAAEDTGASDLRHTSDGWWHFNWKVPKDFDGTCQAFSVVVDHGGRNDLLFVID